MSNIQTLLNQLEHVHKRGNQYRAKCPAHDGQSTGSLTIKDADDKILLHCFGGCGALEVLEACGLTFADVMPERLTHHASPQDRRKWRQDAIHRDWTEALKDVLHECRIIWIAGMQVTNGEPLNTNDSCRLDLAMERLKTIGSLFNGVT